MKNYPTNPLQHGQATVETLVAALTMVPLLMVLPHLGQTLDIKATALETSRYLLGERFLYQETSEGINKTKSSTTIRNEAITRVQNEPGLRISSGTQDTTLNNRFWRDGNNEYILENESFNASVSISSDGLNRGPATELLFLGESLGFSGLAGQLGVPQMDQSRQGKASVTTSYTLKSLARMNDDGLGVTFDATGTAGPTVEFTDQLIGFTGSWSPGSETVFNDKLDALVLDEGLKLATDIGCLAGIDFAGLFKESRYCVENDLESDTRVINNRFLDNANKRGQTQ